MNTIRNSSTIASISRVVSPAYTPIGRNVNATLTRSRCRNGIERKAETLPKLIRSNRFGCAAHAARAALLQNPVSTIETNIPSVIYVRPNGQAVVVSDDILLTIAAKKIGTSGPSGAPALPRRLL